jgi:hypothetical protein
MAVTDSQAQITDSLFSELSKHELLLKNGCDLQQHIYVNFRSILTDSERIFVSFRFDWKTYESNIVLTGRTYDFCGNAINSLEGLLRTPQIPLIGGCWSNIVAMRMLQGQVLVSTMLENVTNALRYMHYNYNYKNNVRGSKYPEIIKVDRCFYAPLLYLSPDNHDCTNTEYMPYLADNYPQSYQYLLEDREGFWHDYHEADVELGGEL